MVLGRYRRNYSLATMETLINILVIGVIAWLSIFFGFLFGMFIAWFLSAFDFLDKYELLGKFLFYYLIIPSIPIAMVVSFLYMYSWWFN